MCNEVTEKRNYWIRENLPRSKITCQKGCTLLLHCSSQDSNAFYSLFHTVKMIGEHCFQVPCNEREDLKTATSPEDKGGQEK